MSYHQESVKLPMGDISISKLFIKPGQTLTVWMCSDTPDGFPRKQVEIRVTSNGQPQIFTNGDVDLRGWGTWRPQS